MFTPPQSPDRIVRSQFRTTPPEVARKIVTTSERKPGRFAQFGRRLVAAVRLLFTGKAEPSHAAPSGGAVVVKAWAFGKLRAYRLIGHRGGRAIGVSVDGESSAMVTIDRMNVDAADYAAFHSFMSRPNHDASTLPPDGMG